MFDSPEYARVREGKSLGTDVEVLPLAPMPGRPGGGAVRAEPDVVRRLLRICEELCERDIPDADMRWYRNRLGEIKEEISAQRGIHEGTAAQAEPHDAGGGVLR